MTVKCGPKPKDRELARSMGARIAVARDARGMNQTELGAMVGVTTNTVYKWECGSNLMSITVARDLCIALEISPNDLFGW